MNALDPARNAGRAVAVTLTLDGEVIDTDRIVSIETTSAVNRIPRARVVLYDGDPATGRFPFSESASFAPGTTVAIAAGYGGDAGSIHAGVIVRQSIRIAPDTSSRIEIETADPLLGMTLARRSAVTLEASEAGLIAALVSKGGGSVGRNQAATTKREAAVQADVTDWDFILLRAEACGCLVLTENGTVDVVRPAEGSPALTLTYGDSILSLDLSIDAAGQLAGPAVESRAWSYTDQAVSGQGAGSVSVAGPGNLSASDLAKVFSVDPFPQLTGATLCEPDLALWSTARLMRQGLSRVRGTVTFTGHAAVKPGGHVALAGVGDRFNGTVFVGGVRHLIRDGFWRTEAELGLEPEPFASRDREIAAPPAAGLTAPLRGLQTGKVDKVATDGAGEHRVRVRLPLLGDLGAVWARVGQFYASSGFGATFLPEVDDEVVLGFMNEDPNSAVILGSLYSSGRAPAHPADEKNSRKALVTRSKLEMTFNDEDRVVKVRTPGGRVVTLDDKAGAVRVEDDAGNRIVMDRNGIEIASAAKLVLTSKTGTTVNCGTALSVSAGQSYGLSAPTVSVSAKQDLSLSSNMMGTLQGSAVLTVKGGLVKIN